MLEFAGCSGRIVVTAQVITWPMIMAEKTVEVTTFPGVVTAVSTSAVRL
jgi:hypothetical protein